ncbi:MAG: hypothetical protein GY795_12405 [Desulfobacterales bacterium]|nr:hypothetical protein [Desulfobacterales bacterium]
MINGVWFHNDYTYNENLPAPTASISADPENIQENQSSVLTWTTAYADTCVIEPGIGTVGLRGSVTVSPTETTKYTITATSSVGTTTADVTVNVQSQGETCSESGGDFNIVLDSPQDGAVILLDQDPCITVSGSMDLNPGNSEYTDEVYINGDQISSEGNSFSEDICLDPGENEISVDFSRSWEECVQDCWEDCWEECYGDECWEVCQEECNEECNDVTKNAWAKICVYYGRPGIPDLIITSPSDGTTVYQSQITVEGTISDPDANVSVNGVPAVVDGDSFEAVITLNAGANTITATASSGTSTAIILNAGVNAPLGASTAQHSITVTADLSPASVSMSAEPASIEKGGTATLSWTSAGATDIRIDNNIGAVSVNGSVMVSPEYTTVYTITAVSERGVASDAVEIRVTGDPAPLPKGAFGKKYESLVPDDATIDEYDDKRFSVITGLVQSADGSPLPDVSVTARGGEEYGTAVTDAGGRFSLPVEGGTTMTAHYRKTGMISVERKIFVPWNDIAVAETIRMIAEDSASTTVVFDGNPDTVVTHQSTAVTDESGSRSCTMVFTGDNKAYVTDENGNDIGEMKTFTTRASEYTVPEAMPAELPPTSDFTYCVELSVDGAQRVRFDKPVVTYVDNFLGFEVGEGVPAGYYDRDKGLWIASKNGVVVRLLDTDTDGVVDALDADGDGAADDLDSSGSFSDEVIGLGDNQKYVPGTTYLRVPVTHFTPWDFNWCSFLALLNMMDYGDPETDDQCDGDCKNEVSSFVETRSRVFHEDIPISGTDMTLHYSSNRTQGHEVKITVPAGGTLKYDNIEEIIVSRQDI